MDGATMLGIGIAILGIGAPATVALIKLLPSKMGVIECPVREHEARMGLIERDVAVLQENTATVRATLLRIENKLDIIHGQHKE